MRLGRVPVLEVREHLPRELVVGFPIEREAQIVDQVIVAGKDAGGIVEDLELVLKGREKLLGVAPVVAVAGARVEQRVAAEKRRLIAVR